MNHQAKLLRVLQIIKNRADDDKIDTEYGICTNMTIVMEDNHPLYFEGSMRALTGLFQSWGKFTGDIAYPVPGVATGGDSYDAARKYVMTANMWEGAYGQLRYDLLCHCIQELEKVVPASEVPPYGA